MDLYPLTFEPILKERVWGGRKLEELYQKRLPHGVPIGESWEICDRVDDVSRISNGRYAGKDLHWLIENARAELMGQASLHNGRFPLLIKILDAREKLSLQVHPPAGKAQKLGGEPKTELWYVAEAGPDSELYVGLKRSCTREEFARRISDGTVADCFHRLSVRAGDVMFLPSGRVHALGAGMVIFEIQQNSDTTYRVFDWNRVGLDGKPRDLHVKESLESIDFDDFEPDLAGRQSGTGRMSELVSHPLFTVSAVKMGAGETLQLPSGKMQILGIISGDVSVNDRGTEVRLVRGQFCLIPASLKDIAVSARNAAEFLCVVAGEKAGL